ALRPDLKLAAREQAIATEDEVVALFSEVDLVVLAADSPAEIEQWCNVAALRTGTPWVNGAYAGAPVCVTRYDPAEGPCWRCMRLDLYDEDPVAPPATYLHKVTAATATSRAASPRTWRWRSSPASRRHQPACPCSGTPRSSATRSPSR